MLRALLLAGCFFATAGITAAIINSRLAFPPVPDLAPRFEYFAREKDKFDTLFIGSSRIRYQIVPQLFDDETAIRGMPTHSFNLGNAGMWPPESFYFLRQVLALHPAKLRWVVIELMDHRFGEAEHQAPTMRMAYWHDRPHTILADREVLETALPPLEKSRQIARHTWLFAQRLTNLGRGAEWCRAHFLPTRNREDIGWIKRRGFDPDVELTLWSDWARTDFARQVDAVKTALPPYTLHPSFAAALRDLLKDLNRAGVEPIFIIAPTVRSDENLVQGLPQGLVVLSFNHPQEYPQLYVPEAHADTRHLNELGARLFTSLVGAQFVERVSHH